MLFRRRAGRYDVRQNASGPYRRGATQGRRRRSRVNIFRGGLTPVSLGSRSGQSAEHREANPGNGGGAEPNRSSSAVRIRARAPAVHRFARSNLGCFARAHRAADRHNQLFRSRAPPVANRRDSRGHLAPPHRNLGEGIWPSQPSGRGNKAASTADGRRREKGWHTLRKQIAPHWHSTSAAGSLGLLGSA